MLIKKFVNFLWVLGFIFVPPFVISAAASFNSTSSPTVSAIIAPLFTPEVQYWNNEIITWANKHDLDPNLVATVMQIESCGDPKAKSGAGAMGLFQVMPFHFEDSEDGFYPETNAYRGLSYLKKGLYLSDGNVGLALAGYNGGHSRIGLPQEDWANETKRYFYWGTGIYQDAIQGKESSDRLTEWLEKGGASLCSQAQTQLTY